MLGLFAAQDLGQPREESRYFEALAGPTAGLRGVPYRPQDMLDPVSNLYIERNRCFRMALHLIRSLDHHSCWETLNSVVEVFSSELLRRLLFVYARMLR